ncbi:hypothetical protein B0I28_101890 [Glycomyces artemisiae]|uniref:Uncharacterized protein n=1 Tax=Glycomyces artemisiae TaxID=1076443 RepID=A0A2T0UXA7_9ACTN|nr:hypothetical protein B0I28_101890 [Glycomyces artemisiae]
MTAAQQVPWDLDEACRIEAEMHRDGWYDPPQAQLEAIITRAAHRIASVGDDFATEELNDFFDAQCSGMLVPDQWQWSGTRIEGRFDHQVHAGVLEWARWAGGGQVYAELGMDDVVWTDCTVFRCRFTIWGYLPYRDMLGIDGLRADFRP